jgi:cbb3-type cytochrome oxidase maturation protein
MSFEWAARIYMSVIYGLIPGMIVLGLVSVLVFFWAVKNGQYDDMEGPAHRILDDDDLTDHDSAADEQQKLRTDRLTKNKNDNPES